MSFRVCASFSYKYHQTSPDHGLSACLLLEFASDSLSAQGHTVGTKHDCRGVAKSVNSAAPVHLMFHVTSEQIGGCHLQVGTRRGKSPGIHPAPTITEHIVFQGTHEGIPTGLYNQVVHKLCQPHGLSAPVANIYHTTGKPGKK